MALKHKVEKFREMTDEDANEMKEVSKTVVFGLVALILICTTVFLGVLWFLVKFVKFAWG